MSVFFGSEVPGFVPSAKLDARENKGVLAAFVDDGVVIPKDAPALLAVSDAPELGLAPSDLWSIGSLDGVPWFAAAIDGPLPDRLRTKPVRRLFGSIEPTHLVLAALAGQVAHFDRSTRFCGRCGAKMLRSETERAKRCPTCERDVHPQIAPCVIVLVADAQGILLTRGPKFPAGMYGLVAGFVEPGETLEACVAREVLEETNVVVGKVHYIASQPWPFPSQLMVGYFTRRVSGDVRPDPVELEDAKFFATDALPMIPPPFSIARNLIDQYLAGAFDDLR